MRFLIYSLVFTFISAQLFAQSVAGDWYGSLDVQKRKLHLVFHIIKDENGYTTTMDSPDQGAEGIKTDMTSFENNVLNIEIKSIKMRYAAKLDSPGLLNGIFQQNGVSFPMKMRRTKEVTAPLIRPQDPIDFPYSREEVTFTNTKDKVTLAGTLTMPKDKKASSIVILISGSGPQNRDEEIKQFDHRPFLVWADWLTRQGIAVLRYDDRGTAASTGDFKTATSADFAKDAAAAIDFIKSRGDLKEMQLGLIGHSEGGMIAPMVASKDSRVKFIVLLAGPGVPINELLYKQMENGAGAEHVSKVLADLNMQTAKLVYSYMREHKDESKEKTEVSLRNILKSQLAKYPADALQNQSVDTLVNTELNAYLLPWFRYFIAYTPADYLTKVKCPVLALNGTLDKQVDATQNLKAIEEALKKGRNKSYEIVPMDGLNHLFQKATTGNPGEYGQIVETVNPAALTKVSDWINSKK